MPDKKLMQDDLGDARVGNQNFYGHAADGRAFRPVGPGPVGRALGAFEREPAGWADEGGWYERLPPLYAPADWGAVLNLPEIEEWLRRTAERVRDLAEFVQHDTSNRHIDLHLVQLKDISEDISSHVEVVHALLETAFPLRLLAVSVQVLLDIQAAHLLWHQLRVSTLVLRERIVRCLQDSNGNFTRQPDILQAVGGGGGEHSCFESLGSVEDLQNLIVKCSKNYFSLDCGITAIELSDYSPKEEEAAAPHADPDPDGREPLEADAEEEDEQVKEVKEVKEETVRSAGPGRRGRREPQPDVGAGGFPGMADGSRPLACGSTERQDRAGHGGVHPEPEAGLPHRERVEENEVGGRAGETDAPRGPTAVTGASGRVPSGRTEAAHDELDRSDADCSRRRSRRQSAVAVPVAPAGRFSAPEAGRQLGISPGRPSSPPRGDARGATTTSTEGDCEYFQASSDRSKGDGDEVDGSQGGGGGSSSRATERDGERRPRDAHAEEEEEKEESYLTLSHSASLTADEGEPLEVGGGRAGDPGDLGFSGGPGVSPRDPASPPRCDSAEYLALLTPPPPPPRFHAAARDLDDWELSEAASDPGSPERGHGTPVPWDEPSPDAEAGAGAVTGGGRGTGFTGKPFDDTFPDASSDDEQEGALLAATAPALDRPGARRLHEELRGCLRGHPDADVARRVELFAQRLGELEGWVEAAAGALHEWTPPHDSANAPSPTLQLNPDAHRAAKELVLAEGLALLSLPQLAQSGLKGELERVERLWRELSEGAPEARGDGGGRRPAGGGIRGDDPTRTDGTRPDQPQANGPEASEKLLQWQEVDIAVSTEEGDEEEDEEQEATMRDLWAWLCNVDEALAGAAGWGPLASPRHHQSLLKVFGAELPLWRRRVERIAVRAAEGGPRRGGLHARLRPLLRKWDAVQALLEDACPPCEGDGGSPAVRALLGADAAALLTRLGVAVRHLRRWLLHAEQLLLHAAAAGDADLARDLDAHVGRFKSLCAHIRQRRRGMGALLRLCHRLLEHEESAAGSGGRSPPHLSAATLHGTWPGAAAAGTPQNPDGAPGPADRTRGEPSASDELRPRGRTVPAREPQRPEVAGAPGQGGGAEWVEAAEQAGGAGEVRRLAEGMERRWEALVLQAVHWQSRLQRCCTPEQAPLRHVDASLADLCCSSDEALEWDETDLDNELITSTFDDEGEHDEGEHAEEEHADDDPTSAYFSASAPRGRAPRATTKEKNDEEEEEEERAAGGGGMSYEPGGSLVYQVYSVHDVSLDADPTLPLDGGFGLRGPGKAKGLVKSASKDSSFSSTESLLNLLDGLLGDGWGTPGVTGECESGIASEGDAATMSDSRPPGDDAAPGGAGDVRAATGERCPEKGDAADERRASRRNRPDEDDRETPNRPARPLGFYDNGHFPEEPGRPPHVTTSAGFSGAQVPDAQSPPPPPLPRYCLSDRDDPGAAEKKPLLRDAAAAPEPPSPTSSASLTEDERDLPSMNSSADSTCMGGEECYYHSGAPADRSAATGVAAAGYLSEATLELLQQLEKASGRLGGRAARGGASGAAPESVSARPSVPGARPPPEGRPRGREDSVASISEPSDGSCEDVSLTSDDRGEPSASPAEDASVSMIVNISGTSVCSEDDGDDDTDLLSSSTVTLSDDEEGDNGGGDEDGFCVDEETSSSSGSWDEDDDDDDDSDDSESFSEDECAATTTANHGFYLRPAWDAAHLQSLTAVLSGGDGAAGRPFGTFYARFSRPDPLTTTLVNPSCAADEGGLLPPGTFRGAADPGSASNADFENGNVDESPYLSSFEEDSLCFENPEGETLYAPEGRPISQRDFLAEKKNKKKMASFVQAAVSARAAREDGAERGATGAAGKGHRLIKKSHQRWSHPPARGDELTAEDAGGPEPSPPPPPGSHLWCSAEPSVLQPTTPMLPVPFSTTREAGGVTRSSSASSLSFSRISDVGPDSVEIDCAAVTPLRPRADALTLAMEAQLSCFEATMVAPLRRRRREEEEGELASPETGTARPARGVCRYVTEIIEIASAALVKMSAQSGGGGSVLNRTSSFRQRSERSKPAPHAGEPRKAAAYSYVALRDSECAWELSSCDDDMSSTPLLPLDEDTRSEEDGERGVAAEAPRPGAGAPSASLPPPAGRPGATSETEMRGTAGAPEEAAAPSPEGSAPPLLPPRRPLPPLPPPRNPPPPPPRRSSSLPHPTGAPASPAVSSVTSLTGSPASSPDGAAPASPATYPATSSAAFSNGAPPTSPATSSVASPNGAPSASPARSPTASPNGAPSASPAVSPATSPAASPAGAPPTPEEEEDEEEQEQEQANRSLQSLQQEDTGLDENSNSSQPTERSGKRRSPKPTGGVGVAAWTRGQDRNKNDLVGPGNGNTGGTTAPRRTQQDAVVAAVKQLTPRSPRLRAGPTRTSEGPAERGKGSRGLAHVGSARQGHPAAPGGRSGAKLPPCNAGGRPKALP
ncbi:A-kinase anchor protein 6-like isoform X2 [Lethenteron reissneri]|uniref:A-kinase anchor protein 6-like isoform X2 n=1 Tax=Lethenteron reissneri TaxID=7753 RepID=UPI002AB6C258|nr:A-kinase anchor protein 6-like isoform X2 [Lethenteron reissneri]